MNLFLRLKNRSWKSTAAFLVTILGLLFWFAPALVVRSPLWPRILDYVTRDVDAQLQTGSVSVGWLSPIVIHDLVLLDASGEAVVTSETVRVGRSLWSLVWNQQQLGTIRIEQPQVSFVFHQTGSNLEDLLAPLLADSSSSPPPQGQVEILDGRIRIADAVTGDKATLSEIEAQLQLPGGAKNDGWGFELKRCMVASRAVQGSCRLQARWGGPAESTTRSGSTMTVALHADRLPLQVAQPLIRRFVPDVHLSGVLTSSLQGQWDPAENGVVANVDRLVIESLELVAPNWIGQDRMRVRQLAVQGHCRIAGDQLQLERVKVQSDFAHAAANGRWTLPATQQPQAGAARWKDLLQGEFTIDGGLDLAQLAATLPNTMHVRADTIVESGQVRLHAECQPQGDGRRWTAQLTTSDLAAIRDGRRIVWEQPFGVQLRAQQTAQQLSVEELTCSSEFLQVTGRGTYNGGKLSLDCNLSQLAQQLGQVVNLERTRLAGTLTGNVNWTIPAGGAIKLDGGAQLQQFRLQLPGQGEWQESQLTLIAAAEGSAEAQRVRKVNKASLSIQSPTDRLDVELLEPIENTAEVINWPVGLRVTGQWSSWISRVRPFVSLPPGVLQGTMELTAKSRVTSESVTLTDSLLRSEPFRVSSPSLNVNEPVVELQMAGRWDMASGELAVEDCVLQSSALALRAKNVKARFGPEPRQLSGDIAARADLESLAGTWQFAPQSSPRQAPWRFRGQVQGRLSLAEQAGVLSARWTASLENGELQRNGAAANRGTPELLAASIATNWITVLREPQIDCSGSVRYDVARATVNLERLELVTTDEQRLAATGTLSDLSGRCLADLQGQVTYNLSNLAERARPQLGSDIHFVGQDTQSFSLRGPLRATGLSSAPVDVAIQQPPQPLVSAELSGHCGLTWKSADLLGMSVGGGQIQPRLEAGAVETGPIMFPLNEGQLRMVPHFYLNQQPPFMTLDPGQVLQAIHISEEMCEGWLKFVAPLVAGSTRAAGTFSLALDQTAVPLLEPKAGNVRGELEIVQAVVSPGPLAQPLIWSADLVKNVIETSFSTSSPSLQGTQLNIPPQVVRFQLANQRVHHNQFHVVVGSVTLRTRGSVGLDQSLSLVAEIPIQARWVAGDRMLKQLEGKVLEVPIGGTLQNPQIDGKKLERSAQNMIAHLLHDAAGRVLEKELQKGLQQLFRQ